MSNSGGIYLHKEQVADRMKGCSHGDCELSTGGTWVRPNTKQNQQRRERKGEVSSSVPVESLSPCKKITRSHVAIGLHEQASFNERRVKVRQLGAAICNCTVCEGCGEELLSILRSVVVRLLPIPMKVLLGQPSRVKSSGNILSTHHTVVLLSK